MEGTVAGKLEYQRHHHLPIRYAVFGSRLGAGSPTWARDCLATLGAQLASGGSIGAGMTSGDIHSRLDGYVNINNFVPAPGRAYSGAGVTRAFGDLRRNIYRGPFQQNWDFSLIKHFRFTERQDLRFTADFFNLWNHANFCEPHISGCRKSRCIRQNQLHRRHAAADPALAAVCFLA